MTITLRIEYQALWGSEMFIYTGAKVQTGSHIPPHAKKLENDGHGHWFTEVCSDEFAGVPYHYAVTHLGVVVASEWGKGHKIDNNLISHGTGCLRIWNAWIDTPHNPEFDTLGFTQGVFRHPHRRALSAPTPDTLSFRIKAATIRPEHKIALIGNIPELGEWDTSKAIVAEPDGLPYWRVTIDRTQLHYPIYFKFILIDAASGDFVAWEDCPNRFFEPTAFYPGDTLFVDDLQFANPLQAWHGVGVSIDLNHIRSIKGCAIGEFADIKLLVDWAVWTGLRVIQLQPVNDCGESSKDPYRVSSGFALDYRYIRPTDIGTLDDEASVRLYNHRREILNNLPKVKLSEIKALKSEYLCALYKQEKKTLMADEGFRQYQADNSWWLDDYARLIAEKNQEHEEPAKREALFYKFVQYNLHKQLQEARNYARQQGILLMATTPHGILKHSIDSELYRQYYNLGLKESHSYLSRVRQQRITHPTFNWFALEGDNYKLLHQRLQVLAQYFDACQPDGLLGQIQETSEFWHIIADKSLHLLKESSPILLYTPEDAQSQAATASVWWEAQYDVIQALKCRKGLMTILPLERWCQLSENRNILSQMLENIICNDHMNKIINNILITNKLLF